jgi:hypothetical protein
LELLPLPHSVLEKLLVEARYPKAKRIGTALGRADPRLVALEMGHRFGY